MRTSLSGPRLRFPPDPEWHDRAVYGVGAAFQVGPDTAASILTQSVPALRITNAGVASVLFHSAIAGRTSADLQGIGTWPLVRFIVLNDISASATAAKHQFSAYLTGWSNSAR